MNKYETKDSILDQITWVTNVIKHNESFDRLSLVQKLEEIWDDVNYYL